MKLKTFFAESSNVNNHPYKDLDDLLYHVRKYFEITNLIPAQSSVFPGSPVTLTADLRVKMSIKFKTLPLNIRSLYGKLDLRSSGIEDLSELPLFMSGLVLGMDDTGPSDLSTLGTRTIPTLTIDGLLSIITLNNSGITTSAVVLARCQQLSSLSGIENFGRGTDVSTIRMTINNCPALTDDLTTYPDHFMFTFKDKKIPPRMPIAYLIAQAGNREFPQVDTETLNELKKKYPQLVTLNLFGGGAKAILPILKFFRNFNN